ncbi:carboxylesterase family protein [Georgenia sp. EYE_87]|uniref:carboxylesterase family protein n=1 Tax=Georgenia sp. EYE_87 TaxID=2853448 RepID=UPI002005D51E|nr:carboxylesterase family protein [Georgenia sp. EYE_87]MCK6211072.1 carboxylesterase family protein [Georgenia sp. EYE_87]
MSRTVTVATPSGTVLGAVTDGVADFRAVRYADGDRFAEARSPARAQGPVTAFPQRPGALDVLLGPALGELRQSEDSFFVRIQAPADAHTDPAGLPVLVFVPGGGFLSGSPHARWFRSPELVRDGRMVLVTVGYRLGALGALGPGGDPHGSARPFRDLIRALRWVHGSISAFGGDPESITLAGDSAGAWYAYALSITPALAGVIRRTVLVSLPRFAPLSGSDHAQRRALFLDAFGAPSELGAAPVGRILDAQTTAARGYHGAGFPFAPAACEGLPDWLSDYATSAPRLHTGGLLLLTTGEESAAFLRGAPRQAQDRAWLQRYLGARFEDPDAALASLRERRPGASPYRLAVDAGTLHQFRAAALEIATAAAVPTRVVRLAVQSPLPDALSPHCFTLPFLFGGRSGWHDAPMLDGLDHGVFDRTEAVLHRLLLDVVHDRGRSALAPVYDPGSPQTLEIDEAGVRAIRPDDIELGALRLIA